MTTSQIILVLLLSGSVAGIAYSAIAFIGYLKTRKRLYQDMQHLQAQTSGDEADLDFRRSRQTRLLFQSVELIASRLSTSRNANDATQRKLMQAGIFYEHGIFVYRALQVFFGIILPIILAIVVLPLLGDYEALYRYLLLALLILICVAIPDVILSRRTEAVQDQCRKGFPDFLDLMVVATEAGMSLEAALARVSEEVSRHYEHLGRNLYLTNIEIRLGRSLGDALQSLADRVGIEEIRGFVTTLAQSREYGTSIANTLRVFSDDMRDKRQMTAEERAQELPVKLVFPLALFLLPVMLLVALWPVIIRIKAAFGGA